MGLMRENWAFWGELLLLIGSYRGKQLVSTQYLELKG
jgi:hypothetical protein